MSCGNCASCSCKKDDVKHYTVGLSDKDVRLLVDMVNWAAYEYHISYKGILERIVNEIEQQNDSDNR